MADSIEDYSLSFEGSEVETLLQKIKLRVSGRAGIVQGNYRPYPPRYSVTITDSKFSLFTSPICVVSVDMGGDTSSDVYKLKDVVARGIVDTNAGTLTLELRTSNTDLLGAKTAYVNYIVTEADI